MGMLRLDGIVELFGAGGAFGVVVGRRRLTHRPAAANGMILAQNSVDGGDDQYVPEHDDGGKSKDQRGGDQVDGHGALLTSCSSETDVGGRMSASACAAPRAWSAFSATRWR